MNPFKKKLKEEKQSNATDEPKKKTSAELGFQDLSKDGSKIKEEMNEDRAKTFEKSSNIHVLTKEEITIKFKEPEKEETKNEQLKPIEQEQIKPTIDEEKSPHLHKEELNLTPGKDGIYRITDKSMGDNQNTQQIIFKDASSVVAEKLPAQLGSDFNTLAKGIFDVRRLTHINEIERVWMSYFDLLDPFEGGDFARAFSNSYANYAMSIGGERAKLLVKMQMAASGVGGQLKKPEDKRNFIEKHFTKRGQEPKDDDINEL